MSNLHVINAVVFGLLTVVWSKSNWLNLALKAMFMALLVFNVLAAVKK
jgi:hypothetical protein